MQTIEALELVCRTIAFRHHKMGILSLHRSLVSDIKRLNQLAPGSIQALREDIATAYAHSW